jgi:hypothetical protein
MSYMNLHPVMQYLKFAFEDNLEWIAQIETSFDVPVQMILKGIAGLTFWYFDYKIGVTIACSFRVDISIVPF